MSIAALLHSIAQRKDFAFIFINATIYSLNSIQRHLGNMADRNKTTLYAHGVCGSANVNKAIHVSDGDNLPRMCVYVCMTLKKEMLCHREPF